MDRAININRQFEVKCDNGEWKEVAINQIKKNDMFRIFDNDERYVTKKGRNIFYASSDAYKGDDGEWQIATQV